MGNPIRQGGQREQTHGSNSKCHLVLDQECPIKCQTQGCRAPNRESEYERDPTGRGRRPPAGAKPVGCRPANEPKDSNAVKNRSDQAVFALDSSALLPPQEQAKEKQTDCSLQREK